MATMKKKLRKKQIECELQQLETWSNPDCWRLEQYHTPPNIASQLLHDIQEQYGDISGHTVADLGCGYGMLTIGCCLLGAESVVAVDIDSKALDVLRENIRQYDLEDTVSIVEGDVNGLILPSAVDVVIMNPPFGTKLNPGIDKVFVQTALSIAPVVYSLHKRQEPKQRTKHKPKQLPPESNDCYWIKPKVVKELNCSSIELLDKRKYNIDRQFRHHRKDSVDINVDLVKFVKETDNK